MLAGLMIARLFRLTGGVLLLIGLLLWAFLPIHLVVPPYLLTPLLALGYSAWCWHSYRTRGDN
jgi:hypothetical protein